MRDAQQAVLDAYFDGINGERYEAVGALFAPGGTLVAPGLAPRTGPAEIAPYFAAALAPYPVHHDAPTRFVHAEGTVTVEITFTGELANGAPMTFEAVDVFDFDAEHRITRLLSVYDSHLVRRRLAEAQARDDAAAQVRGALLGVREGTVSAVGGWTVPPTRPIAARVVLVDVEGLAGASLRSGDALVVRTGGAALALPAAPVPGLAAIAADGPLTVADAAGVAVGEHWDLGPLEHGRGSRVLVATPGGCAAILA